MTDLLVYWRDYRENLARRLAGEPVAYWHSNSRLLGRLAAGDQLWMVTSGAAARVEPKEAAFLVAIWNVVEAVENLGDDPDYPPTQYRHRVVADSEESVWFGDPVPVDHILRPEKWNKSMPIGRLVDREEMIRSEPDRVREFAKSTLNELIGEAAFRVYRYPDPNDDSYVGDEPRLTLVVLDLNYPVADEELAGETERLVSRILKQHGKGFRNHANMLIFLAPDQQRVSEIHDASRRLLALKSIDEHKQTKGQLTDEQLKDLAARLKEAEGRLPGALAGAYHYVIVPAEKKTTRVTSIGVAVGKATLSQRVLEKLKDDQLILEKLDPAILIGERFGLWPPEQESINVKTLAEYFTKLTHLPRLLGNGVLPHSIAWGVGRGLFAYALGDGDKREFDTIYFNGKSVTAADCEITETAWLVRPVLAKTLMPEPEPPIVATGGAASDGTGIGTGTGRNTVTGGGPTGAGSGDDEWSDKPGKVVIKQGERRLNKVRVEIKNLPWENWHDIYNEVIQPLANEGAEVHCQLVVIAKGDAAIRENTVELGIKESLGQRDIDADIQTG